MEEIGPKFLEIDGVPAFVVLRYEAYQRLLALAAPYPDTLAGIDCATDDGTSGVLDVLTTPTTDRLELLTSGVKSSRSMPNDRLIPHDVIAAVVHNHWSLVRAWREYLGLKQVTLAQRLNVSIPDLEEMEAQYAPLRPSTRKRLAEGLGIRYEQLPPRRRRLRRAGHKQISPDRASEYFT